MELVARILSQLFTAFVNKYVYGDEEAVVAIPAARQAVFFVTETLSAELHVVLLVLGIACLCGVVFAASASCCFGGIRCAVGSCRVEKAQRRAQWTPEWAQLGAALGGGLASLCLQS